MQNMQVSDLFCSAESCSEIIPLQPTEMACHVTLRYIDAEKHLKKTTLIRALKEPPGLLYFDGHSPFSNEGYEESIHSFIFIIRKKTCQSMLYWCCAITKEEVAQ